MPIDPVITAPSIKPSSTAAINKEQEAIARATKRGTRIVKPGQEMDKNSFLRILSAELSNQDPTKSKDGTEFVAQMAQFASLEQMTNLNSTVSFSTSSALVGKTVALNSFDEKGVQHGGTVRAVYKQSGATMLSVQLLDGSIKDFPADSLSDILDVPDYRLDYINGNTSFSSAVSLMGKHIEAMVQEGDDAKNTKNYTGIVKSVFRDANGTNLTIAWQENGEEHTKDINYNNIIKVQE